ncbi:MAG: hypothetical protein QNJ16_15765 [Rhodobacter sp.]|nr:hypothetical protein [Rhodobacter sp.]
MVDERVEAAPIARLLGADRSRLIGLVYMWNTGELSFLWIHGRETAKFVEPLLRSEVLANAKPTTPVDVIEFLESLSDDDEPNRQR